MTAQNQSRHHPLKQNLESQRPSQNQHVIQINPNKIQFNSNLNYLKKSIIV